MTNKYTFIIFICCLASLMLTNCSRSNNVFITNNTGHDLIVISTTSSTNASQRSIFIANGKGLSLSVADSGEGWSVNAKISGCLVTYFIPSGRQLKFYVWETKLQGSKAGSYIKLQIEPNFMIHLIPQTQNGIVNITAFTALQKGRFPLEPLENSCK